MKTTAERINTQPTLQNIGKWIFLFIPAIFLVASKPVQRFGFVAYKPGEEIRYRVHYGIFTAGEAVMRVNPLLYRVNNRICYRAEVVGNSKGAFDKIIRIRNIWGSYFDTANFQPQKSFRSIQENRYRKKEEIYFDYSHNMAKIQTEEGNNEEVAVSPGVQDMVSGYYFMRLLNYDNYRKKDTIRMNGIFENKTYDFRIIYLGKERIKTKFGKTDAFLISPIMPKNTLFSGKNPIKMWISDDKNRIPLKIEAELMLGSLDMDIQDYQNLKYPIRFE
jgi:hypothetical protein